MKIQILDFSCMKLSFIFEILKNSWYYFVFSNYFQPILLWIFLVNRLSWWISEITCLKLSWIGADENGDRLCWFSSTLKLKLNVTLVNREKLEKNYLVHHINVRDQINGRWYDNHLSCYNLCKCSIWLEVHQLD